MEYTTYYSVLLKTTTTTKTTKAFQVFKPKDQFQYI